VFEKKFEHNTLLCNTPPMLNSGMMHFSYLVLVAVHKNIQLAIVTFNHKKFGENILESIYRSKNNDWKDATKKL
jgi:hypothetical protein